MAFLRTGCLSAFPGHYSLSHASRTRRRVRYSLNCFSSFCFRTRKVSPAKSSAGSSGRRRGLLAGRGLTRVQDVLKLAFAQAVPLKRAVDLASA